MRIRQLYLYLFSFVGLLVMVIGTIQIVNLGLNVYIFKEADRYDYFDPNLSEEAKIKQQETTNKEQLRQRQRQLSTSLSMLAVGVPLYLYHWQTIARENKKD